MQTSRNAPEKTPPGFYDVIVVGGGPAGLSAALVLARCCRRVLVIDSGKPRNWASHAVNGFLTRDGLPPADLRRIGKEQLLAYPCVSWRDGEVRTIAALPKRFQVTIADAGAELLLCRKLLLTTGVIDKLPPLEGIEPLYGNSVWHCPICNGYEVRDKPLAVYATDRDGAELAAEMLVWSRDLVLLTHGSREVPAKLLDALREDGVQIIEKRISRLLGNGGQLERVCFDDGTSVARAGLFFSSPQCQNTPLAESLGCQFTSSASVKCGPSRCTNVEGLWVAGNASACGGMQLAIVAAAEGAQAAFDINCALAAEDFRSPCR